MNGLVVYVREGLLFARYLSLENSADSYVFDWIYFTQCLTSFSSISHLLRLHALFDSISSNIDGVLPINPSANVYVLGDFNVHHKDWLTYSGGTDRSGELCYNFSQTTLLRWLTFLQGSQIVTLTVLLFWISFFLLTLIFVLQWLSLNWEILIMLLSQFSLTFRQIHNGMPRFIK